MTIDFSTADDQTSREIVPANTIAAVCLAVKAGNAGPDGWLTASKTGDSLGLDTKFTVIDGPYKGATVYNRFTLSGQTEGQKKAGRISASTIRAILESARNIAPDPTKSSPAWLRAVQINSYGDLHGLCLLIKVGVEPARGEYKAKNTIASIVTPGMPEYYHVRQVPIAAPASTPVNAGSTNSGAPGVIPLPPPSSSSVSDSGMPKWAGG
jgi:hypothetical protein